jgi:Cu-Zn family superoxide dismutase
LEVEVEGLGEGNHTLTVHNSGNLFDTWNQANKKFSIDIEIKNKNVVVWSDLKDVKLEGAGSIVGLGMSIKLQDKPIKRGVIGAGSTGAGTIYGAGFASCKLQPTATSRYNISGVVYLSFDAEKMHVVAEVIGLEGRLMFGIHIHEFGNLNSNDGMATGGHYNPDGKLHGLPGGLADVHAGDLGNIAFYDNTGTAWYNETKPMTSAVLGRAIVIHSQMDNGCDQPTGGAGSRLAFCVIGVVNQNPVDAFQKQIPFSKIPEQKGSSGCSLNNNPEKSPKSATFIWITVTISLALVIVGGLFVYNWWKAKNSPNSSSATGRSVWQAHQNEEDEEAAP